MFAFQYSTAFIILAIQLNHLLCCSFSKSFQLPEKYLLTKANFVLGFNVDSNS